MNKAKFAIMNLRKQSLYALVAITLSCVLLAPPSMAQLTNTKIAFHTTRDGNFEIYVMNADGTGQTRLTTDPSTDWGSSWSPDGTKIVFSSYRDGNQEIYVMNADGANQTRLTNDPAADYQPSWSPDGTRIAFVSTRDGNDEIYVMNADGSNQTNLTHSGRTDYSPSWSPDGSQIGFVSDRSGNDELYVMNADGTNPTRLTYNPSYEWRPRWSPDGLRIVYQFYSFQDGTHEIYVMNADGSNPINLTNNPAEDGEPAWSPDGTKIAFNSDRDGNQEIYVMNADGTNPTRLTTTLAGEWGAVWSPFLMPTAGKDTLLALKDTYVRTDLDVRRNDNYGRQQAISIGTSRGGGGIPFGGADAMRMLVQFDLTGVSPTNLTSAVLELTVFESVVPSTYQVDVHRIVASGSLTPWIEGNGFEGYPLPPGCANTEDAFGVAWVGANDGGDANNQTQPNYDPTLVGTATIDGRTTVPGNIIRWDVTSLMKAWLDGTVPNYGMLLRDGTSDGTFRQLWFGARDGKLRHIPDPRNQDGPRLILKYAPPLIVNGGFESGRAPWVLYTINGGSFDLVSPGFEGNYAGRVSIPRTLSLVLLQQSALALQPNTKYRLSFAAYSTTGHDMLVFVTTGRDMPSFMDDDAAARIPWVMKMYNPKLSKSWQKFSTEFKTRGFSSTTTDARLTFLFTPFARSGDAYYIDNVVLQKIDGSPNAATDMTAPLEEQILAEEDLLPHEFSLAQNYPNPFNPSTTIRYALPAALHVTLKVYNTLGQEVAALVDEFQEAGYKSAEFNAGSLASGVYFYRVTAGSFVDTKKLLILK
ncbi:MAG: T9SS type A sorting domain-containing protein [Bacteroidota bacterium]